MQEVQADVRFYSTEEGGRQLPALSGYRPVATTERKPQSGFNGWGVCVFTDSDQPMMPGETHRVRLSFLTPEGCSHMRAAGRFYLWEGRTVAEVVIVGGPTD